MSSDATSAATTAPIGTDAVSIGAGPGGYVAAIRAAQLGLNVACVEKEQELGGTCLRIGCIPSKALLESSELFWRAKEDFAHHGIRAKDLQFDLPAIMRRKEGTVRVLSKGVESLFRKNKISRYAGTGRIVEPGSHPALLARGSPAKWPPLPRARISFAERFAKLPSAFCRHSAGLELWHP